MARLTVFALFFLSGISGLIYQVVWVREFGFIFGSTVQSASLVTAVFMGGLGLGSYFIGRWSDRCHGNQPLLALKAYGYSELAIAFLGLLISFTLPQLEALSAMFSTYQVDMFGWYQVSIGSHIFRFAFACLLLTPITFIMGGTLTLLIRYLLTLEFSAVGWRVGLLYGINTAGAALGAFLSDYSLIPSVGVQGAQIVAVSLNLLSAIGVLLLAQRLPPSSRQANIAIESAVVMPGHTSGARFLLRGTAITLFISGFVAMGIEILWFRYLVSGLGAYRAVFSLMMTVILAGIFVGAILGGQVERRLGSPAKLYIIAQLLLVLFTLIPLGLLGAQTYAPVSPIALLAGAGTSHDAQALAAISINLQSIAIIVALPALLMGFTFPLANAHVQRMESAIGNNAGTLYLANTAGNVAGSLITGFLLLPIIGQHQSFTILALLGIVGLIPLFLTERRFSERGNLFPLVAASCLAMVGYVIVRWEGLPDDHLLRNTRPISPAHQVVVVSEGLNENIVIVDEAEQGRRLFTNGHSMSSTSAFAQRYMRLFVHLPLLNVESPESALVICFGVGSTAQSVSLYDSVKRIDIADLSENVLSNAHYFAESNKDVLKDPRVSVYVNDGRQHLRMQPELSYDLITLEPPPIAHAGVAALYSREFYELAKSRLKEGGYMTQWLPAYQVDTDTNLSIIRAFIDVFPNAVLLSGSRTELILMAAKEGATRLNTGRMMQQLNNSPAIRDDLAYIGANSITELAATFAGGPQTLHAATSNSPPVTDDNPLMEYSASSAYHRVRLPGAVFSNSELADWCPDCFDGSVVSYGISELPELMEAFDTLYHSDFFLDHASNLPLSQQGVKFNNRPCGLKVVQRNFYYREMFGCDR